MSCEMRPYGEIPGQAPKGKGSTLVDAENRAEEKRPELIEQMDELEREIEHLADRISNLGDRLEAVMRPEPPAEQAKGIGLTSIPDSPAAQRLHGLRQGAMRIRQRAESLLYRLEV